MVSSDDGKKARFLWSTWFMTLCEPGVKTNKQTNIAGAEEDCLHVVIPTATKATNYPHLIPYPPKEG